MKIPNLHEENKTGLVIFIDYFFKVFFPTSIFFFYYSNMKRLSDDKNSKLRIFRASGNEHL